ncbi:MAG: 4Fe-4S dicluster domain-containing protein [Chitinophagaceae bacterium]|nr:4Fe-4S dicluster domain-containing protein [Oligoflexus sp.]
MTSLDSDLRGLEDKREVFVAHDQPFEKPAKEFVPGPFFVNIEEAMPDLAEETSQEDSSGEKKLAVDRRDLMRLFGAGAILASAACVRRPVEHAVPYVTQPMDSIPGIPTYFATTIDRVGVVVKTREGRPVFIEGNPEHPLSQGSASIFGMSELQALYHPERRSTPQIRFGDKVVDVSWDDVHTSLADVLKESKKVGFLIKGTTGSSVQFYKDFLKQIGQSDDGVYVLESNTLFNSMATAHKMAFGVDGLPRSDLRRAKLLIGVGTDFQDCGIASIFETKSWTSGFAFRNGQKGRFVTFENRMTQTGAKASERYPIAPGDELGVILAFVEALLGQGGAKGSESDKSRIRAVIASQKALIDSTKSRLKLDDAVAKLAVSAVKGGAVLLAGESGASSQNGTLVQLAAIMANILLGAYTDHLLFFDQGWFKNPARPGDVARFLKDAATIDTLFVVDVNPTFTLPASFGVEAIIKGIKHVVSMNTMPSETDDFASHIVNTHNPLECWGDEELVAGFWSIQQPTVRSITNSQQAEDVLLWTAAAMGKPMGFEDYRAYLRKQWQVLYKQSGITKDFDTFFMAIQRKGFYVSQLTKRDNATSLADVSAAFKPVPVSEGLKLVAYLDPKLGDGTGADRPILQEAGDGLTTIAWDTWVAINPNKCRELGLKYNDLVRIKSPAGTVEVSCYPMPGLHADTIAIRRGNGHRNGISKISDGVGIDPLLLLEAKVDSFTQDPVTSGQVVTLEKVGKRYRLAAMQKHNDIANRRDIMPVLTLTQAAKGMRNFKDLDDVPDLYPSHSPKPGDLRGTSWLFPDWKASETYRWGMSFDLDRCNGCGACNVACTLENNIPHVGREQILIGREMTWIRIDRYFSGEVNNPEVAFQPVPCQHCNHAPCEAVCPVFATTHDPEGMNVQTYNRCIGTRYCGNACPYKVRRFNWFTHKWNVVTDNPIDRNPRALNPDVTVRTRGIMEKCSFCVQRIHDAKHNAKQQGRAIVDGEIRTACQTACPTDAITFGNLKDPSSRITRNRRDNRSYLLLNGDATKQEYGLKTLPNVNYLMRVRHDGSEGLAANEQPAGHEHP